MITEKVVYAWHDVTCPEAEKCRSRHLHAYGSHMLPVLDQFTEKLISSGVMSVER